ncbi:fasciclin-like arabinogalactan protein 2 [Andrographis paniculata]|uniref:fasciclin-like arabinogalactan protein 2 n=1 Tax=Andrographis paniculata TaxID=175694 RepID=UPI0021E9A752|nr:fasciclin-like arabinogalactan protein 2 [Andrographis paniculata]
MQLQFSTLLFYCLLFFISATAAAAAAATNGAHNITRILAKHPEFSTFSHYLTVTHLADEINRRRTITVCAVDNAAMNDLLVKHYSIGTIKNVLSLHIFADYFGAKKLHQITNSSTTTSSLFQATGEAAGTSGYVEITDRKGGKVGFTPVDGEGSGEGRPMAMFVKSIEERPYVIAVIQISHILTSPEAEAPMASPTDLNVTTLMAKQGCGTFSDLINEISDVKDTLQHKVESGLTVFCPSDESVDSFMSRYKNLTAGDKASLLLYHALPEYNSLGTLRSSNGVMNTLATEGAKKKFDFTVHNVGDDVKLKTKVVTATITGTLLDDDPLAVFKVDTVLLPTELFKAAPPAPAPKPSKPKKSKSKDADAGTSSDDSDADSPGPSADDDDSAVADAEASSNDGGRAAGGSLLFSLALGIIFAFIS